MSQPDDREYETIELIIHEVERGPQEDGCQYLTIKTNRGDMHVRVWAAPQTTVKGAVFIGGAGGGFDTPVRGRLYPELGPALAAQGVTCCQVQFRHPTDLAEATLDTVCAIEVLKHLGVERVAVVGWSFGGAVAVQAAALSGSVKTLITIATQSYGIDPIAELGPRCSVLLHGQADQTLPPRCSEYAYQIAREPKKLIMHPTANHGLDEWADEVVDLIEEWISQQLDRPEAF